MKLIHCEILEGPREGYKTVGVPSVEGHTEYLAIEERFLARRGEELYLPVTVIGRDRKQGLALVQLPVEADSGANRVWVTEDRFVPETDEVTA